MADEGKNNVGCHHALRCAARKEAEITGVTAMESFDDTMVSLVTECGRMTLEGEGLSVTTLDIERGLVTVTGQLNGVFYSDESPVRRGKRRLFG